MLRHPDIEINATHEHDLTKETALFKATQYDMEKNARLLRKAGGLLNTPNSTSPRPNLDRKRNQKIFGNISAFFIRGKDEMLKKFKGGSKNISKLTKCCFCGSD